MKTKVNVIITLVGIVTLFLGGLFVHVTWNAIAWECNLPQFNYWTCVCAVGAFGIICNFLGKIFHDNSKNDN